MSVQVESDVVFEDLVEYTDKLMRDMADRSIMIVALGAFQLEIVVESFAVERDIPGSVHKSITKQLGTSFGHPYFFSTKLTGLLNNRIQAGKSKQFRRITEP